MLSIYSDNFEVKKRIDILKISLLILAFSFISKTVNSQSPKDSLTQSVQQLQSATGDVYYTLLKKIIDISTRVKPLPAMPEPAREKYVMALSLREDANKEEDFDRPLNLLKEARTLAPWWSDVHKEIGITFEMGGAYNATFYDNAIYNFNNFLLTKPLEEEARKIQDEIYIVKAKKEKAIIKLNEELAKTDAEKVRIEKENKLKELNQFMKNNFTQAQWFVYSCETKDKSWKKHFCGCKGDETPDGKNYYSICTITFSRSEECDSCVFSSGVYYGSLSLCINNNILSVKIMGHVSAPNLEKIKWECIDANGKKYPMWSSIGAKGGIFLSADAHPDGGWSHGGYILLTKAGN